MNSDSIPQGANGQRHGPRELPDARLPDASLPGAQLPDISAIDRLIRRTRALLRSVWVATGLCVSAGLLLAAVCIVSLTDLALTLWPAVRFAGLLLIVVPFVWVFVVGVVQPVLRRLTAVLIARRIEREIPGIHNRLVSCVDLVHHRREHLHSAAFYRRLVREALERIRGFRPQQVLDLVSLRRASLFALGSVLALALSLLAFSDRLPTAMARILQPFADIPPATGIVYQVLVGEQIEPGDYAVLRGDDLKFTVVLERGEISGGRNDPFRLEVRSVDDDGKPVELWYDFDQFENKQCTLTLTGMQHSFRYRVHGGGTWSKQYRVEMLDRPKIVGWQWALHYPKYMKIREPRRGSHLVADITGPKDSTIEIDVDVQGDATEGEIQLLRPVLRKVDVTERGERIWWDEKVPDGAQAEGDWQWDSETAGRRLHFHAAAEEQQVHGFHSAPVAFEVRHDEWLFAQVYLPSDQIPETIMLQWHDGQGWEHRAYWGADKIAEGQPDTASRRRLGDLPAAGRLVRLEIPAELLELQGKQLHGVRFTTFGGRCLWGAVGSLPPPQREVRELAVVESFFLHPWTAGDGNDAQAATRKTDSSKSDDGQTANGNPTASGGTESGGTASGGTARWRGEFPLRADGYYRLELRNKLGYGNPPMKEGKLTALADQPPEVAIERPNVDLIVSKAIKVPLFISAYDDFGLDQIVLAMQRDESGGFQGRPIEKFEQPLRHATSLVTIDMAAENMKVGDTLRYRVEVRDTQGQTASTRDYTVRIAEEPTAADQQLAAFQQQTAAVQEKLANLVDQQSQVQQSIEQLAERFEPLTEKVQQARAAAAKQAEAAADRSEQPAQPEQTQPENLPLELDAEAMQQLTELRGELAQVAQSEQQNVQLGQQLAAEMLQLAEASPNVQLLPPQIARHLQATQQAFEQVAVGQLGQLEQLVQQATKPEQIDPQLPRIERQGEQVQENLEAIQGRLAALSAAQNQSRENVEQAIVDLRNNLLRQDAGRVADDLTDLQQYLASLRAQLKSLETDQRGLIEDNQLKLSQRLFDRLLEEQGQLDQQAAAELAEAGELLDQMRQMPAVPEPAPGDVDQPMPDQEPADPEADAGKKAGNAPASQSRQPMPPPLVPALGGEPPRPDPELARQKRALAQRLEQQPAADEMPRLELQARQLDQAEQLDLAERALESDQQALERLLEQLGEAAADSLSAEQLGQLAELLNSNDVQQARSMMQRLQQLLAPTAAVDENQPLQAAAAQNNELPPAAALDLVNPRDNTVGTVEAILIEIDDLGLDARTVIMKMQPQVREELLQGLREEGPEGYRQFIRDYFRRLTKVQANK